MPEIHVLQQHISFSVCSLYILVIILYSNAAIWLSSFELIMVWD
jgi:hypothetical protein